LVGIREEILYPKFMVLQIPKANIFQFENYWIEHPGFIDVVTIAWNKEKLFYVTPKITLS
jgi:hypothetical protein